MIKLEGKNTLLRALEPSDLDFLYQLENDEKVWEVSQTVTPYSKFVLKQYLDNAHRDIYEVKQLRLVIELEDSKTAAGFIDLFEFDPKNKRAGIGIVIFSEKDRQKGYASEALELLIDYSFKHLDLRQLYANITEDNSASIQLFEKAGFKQNGIKEDWIFSAGGYKNELFYQLINDN